MTTQSKNWDSNFVKHKKQTQLSKSLLYQHRHARKMLSHILREYEQIKLVIAIPLPKEVFEVDD